MPKILHPHPRHNHPNPSHNPRQHHQRRIIPHNRQRRIIFQLRRRIRRLPNIPRPAPLFETRAHGHSEDEPRRPQNYVPPADSRGVVPLEIFFCGSRAVRGQGRVGSGKWGFGFLGGAPALLGQLEGGAGFGGDVGVGLFGGIFGEGG